MHNSDTLKVQAQAQAEAQAEAQALQLRRHPSRQSLQYRRAGSLP
jgi:hypothetical protein